jgi:hypothetical protein
MCKERRATFQKTEMSENGTIHPIFSVNLTRSQAVASALASIVVIIGGVFGGMAWARSSIVETVSGDFQKAMDTYYAKIVPERNQFYKTLLEGELVKFELETSKPIEVRLDGLNTRVTALETQGVSVGKSLDRHERYLLELLRRVPEKR